MINKLLYLVFLLSLLACYGSFAQEREATLDVDLDSLSSNLNKKEMQEQISNSIKNFKKINRRKQKLQVRTNAKSFRQDLRPRALTPKPNNEEPQTQVVADAKPIEESEEDIPMEEAEILVEEKEIEVLEQQEKNELAKIVALEQAIELQSIKNRYLIYGSGGVVLFLFWISVVLYRGNLRKKKTNLLLEEEKQKTEQERDKSDELLLNILPTQVAKELKTTGKAEVKHYDLASVLFTDFKGFTLVAEKLSPTDLVAELDLCFAKFDEIITLHGIEKIKTIGDAYMCAGGIPKANRSNPIDIVLAALEIQRFMKNKRKQKLQAGEEYWQLRLGINSGELIAGVIGRRKFAYDVWGDTVNTAARMESSGEVERVNISGMTYAYVKDFFECEYRGKVSAKNKGEVDMYFVSGIKKELSQHQLGIEPNERFYAQLKKHIKS